MNNANYITSLPLPLNQNFRLLKKQGLAYIQEHSGNEWTNLNPSDPGITILDQVCYALTELGYCNDFSVSDILARHDGTIETRNQFYLPEEILTTAPVTIKDYRKYLIDGVAAVTNAVILPVTHTGFPAVNIYQAYLQTDPSITAAEKKKDICRAALYWLNKSRNLGELFAKPLPLQLAPYTIYGSIQVEDEAGIYTLLATVYKAICNHTFPEVTQTRYSLPDDNSDTDTVFNGPLLQYGRITDACLGTKKDLLRLSDFISLTENTPGVVSAALHGFERSKIFYKQELRSTQQQLLSFDLTGSLFDLLSSGKSRLEIRCNGNIVHVSEQKLKLAISKPAQPVNSAYPDTAVIEKNMLPKGKFREISDYYSIQNTFPEIYAVGHDSVNAHASAYQVAQSRQLKGYLTLFDQVLANQFAQLGNIGKLFSFVNATTGAPAWAAAIPEPGGGAERQHTDPAPYKYFSPTYFYQPLYNVPHIRPLLKNNDAFGFSSSIEPDKELAMESWTAYKNDPYNAYMRGLMECKENTASNFRRRNAILDHLLARHGESPLVMDAVIDSVVYTGNRLHDLVIIKSLYLQNLGLLSYFRQKAYNYSGTGKIAAVLTDIPANAREDMLCGNEDDFIFDMERIDRLEKLTPEHFTGYAAIELKMNLLLALRVHYENCILHDSACLHNGRDAKIAWWMTRQRRGVILIERALLWHCMAFTVVLMKDPASGACWQLNEKPGYRQVAAFADAFRVAMQNNPSADLQTSTVLVDGMACTFTPTARPCSSSLFKPIAGTEYFFTVFSEGGNNINLFDPTCPPGNGIDLIFPDFPPFSNQPFKDRLTMFLQEMLPVHIPYTCHFINGSVLEYLIPVFADWHNSMIYKDGNGAAPDGLAQHAANVTHFLYNINNPANA